MDSIHTNALKLIVSIKDVVEFLSSAIDTEQFSAEINRLEKYKLDPADVIQSYVICFRLVDEIQALIQRITNTKLDCDTHSDTFRLAYTKLLNKTKAKYTAFLQDTETVKITITNEISNQVFAKVQSGNKLEELVALRKKYYAANELISIYSNVMQRSIDEFFAQDRDLSYKLLKFISEDKAHVLLNQYQTKSKPVSKNPPQSRFGLLPATESMPIESLLALILGESNSTNNLDQLAKKNNVGFIVINSVVYTPTEYNIQRLINKDLASEYNQPSEFGINKKIVDRFTTLKTLKNTSKWDFSIKIHSENADKFYVLETLDGKTYRCLVPWLSTKNFLVGKFRLEKLLNYKKDEPTKALNYQASVLANASRNMFLGRTLAIDEFESQISQVDSGKIQNKITDAVLNTANDLLNATKITASIDVNNLLHDPIINETFMSAVEVAFAENADNFDGGKFSTAEIMTSFITAMQTTGRRFAREIHNGYAREPLKAEDFTDNTAKNKALAAEKIERVIRNAVELVIKLDNNLFTSSFYKYLILNYAV